jgi:hypothetical protein
VPLARSAHHLLGERVRVVPAVDEGVECSFLVQLAAVQPRLSAGSCFAHRLLGPGQRSAGTLFVGLGTDDLGVQRVTDDRLGQLDILGGHHRHPASFGASGHPGSRCGGIVVAWAYVADGVPTAS